MQQNEKDEYWNLFKTRVQQLTVFEQRKVAYGFSLLVKDYLDDEGLEALAILELLTRRKVSLKRCETMQNKFQAKLPGNNDSSPYSVLIWTLTPHSASYPIWYSTRIAGLNLIDLKISNFQELIKFTNELLDSLSNKIS